MFNSCTMVARPSRCSVRKRRPLKGTASNWAQRHRSATAFCNIPAPWHTCLQKTELLFPFERSSAKTQRLCPAPFSMSQGQLLAREFGPDHVPNRGISTRTALPQECHVMLIMSTIAALLALSVFCNRPRTFMMLLHSLHIGDRGRGPRNWPKLPAEGSADPGGSKGTSTEGSRHGVVWHLCISGTWLCRSIAGPFG